MEPDSDQSGPNRSLIRRFGGWILFLLALLFILLIDDTLRTFRIFEHFDEIARAFFGAFAH